MERSILRPAPLQAVCCVLPTEQSTFPGGGKGEKAPRKGKEEGCQERAKKEKRMRENRSDYNSTVPEGHHSRGTTPPARLCEEICLSEGSQGPLRGVFRGALRGVFRGALRWSSGFSEGSGPILVTLGNPKILFGLFLTSKGHFLFFRVI